MNARAWLSTDTDSETKSIAEIDIVGALPALQALGLFDLMTINDARLRALIDNSVLTQ
ncbi:hypothetical protein [Pseudomonas chlororaphis]|uniref:hypothetical protein n=1 Tax=Pseudomonas chlororaphis TaxID=587753 RepID=UPI0030CA1793